MLYKLPNIEPPRKLYKGSTTHVKVLPKLDAFNGYQEETKNYVSYPKIKPVVMYKGSTINVETTHNDFVFNRLIL